MEKIDVSDILGRYKKRGVLPPDEMVELITEYRSVLSKCASEKLAAIMEINERYEPRLTELNDLITVMARLSE